MKEKGVKCQIWQNGASQYGVCDSRFYYSCTYSKSLQLFPSKLLFFNKTKLIDNVQSQNCGCPQGGLWGSWRCGVQSQLHNYVQFVEMYQTVCL